MLGGLDYKTITQLIKRGLSAGMAYAAKGDVIFGTGPGTAAVKSAPANGRIRMADSNQVDGWLDVPALRGMIGGLTLSNNAGDATNDIDIAAGGATDKDNNYYMNLAAAITGKQLDAVWAVGSNAGMRASGAAIANGTYHIFLIARPDTGVVDIAADTSVTGANIAANTNAAYTRVRRIGSILREGGSIVGFVQNGDLFERKTRAADVNATNPGAAAVTRTLSVPNGISVTAWVMALIFNGTTGNESCYLSALDATDSGPDRTTTFSLAVGGTLSSWTAGDFYIRTNTASQIRSRMETGGASDVLRMSTKGWIDTRGRND